MYSPLDKLKNSSEYSSGNEGGVELPLPTLSLTANSLENLLVVANQSIQSAGYCLVISHSWSSTRSKEPKNRAYLNCKHYGDYRNRREHTTETRKRKNRGSKALGCRMFLEARADAEGLWSLRDRGSNAHSHPALNPALYSKHRTLSTTVKDIIKL